MCESRTGRGRGTDERDVVHVSRRPCVSREQREGKRESTNLLGRQRGGKELLDEVGFGRFLVGEIFTLGGEVLLSRLGLIVGEWH
jgi:hypothetical protein